MRIKQETTKKYRNSFSLIVGFLALFVMLSACGKSETIKIGVEGAYPPFSQTEADGSVVGFDIDIAFALCEEMNVECELVSQDWDGMIPSLLAKKYDAIIASMSITEERLEKVNFTKKYYSSTASFVGKRGSITLTEDVAANNLLLKGKRIGVQQATVSDSYVTDLYGKIATIKRYGKQEEIYLDIAAGRIDLIFSDTVPIDGGFLKTEAGADYELVSPGYADAQWFGAGIGVAVRKEDTKLLEDLNAAILAIREDGKYDEIQSQYFDFDIYGE